MTTLIVILLLVGAGYVALKKYLLLRAMKAQKQKEIDEKFAAMQGDIEKAVEEEAKIIEKDIDATIKDMIPRKPS